MPAEAAAVFAALGDPTRLRLARALTPEGRPLSALAAGLPMTRQAVAKHLRVLEAAGLAEARAQGRETLWRARPEGLAEARARLDEVAAFWAGALARLKARVEGERKES